MSTPRASDGGGSVGDERIVTALRELGRAVTISQIYPTGFTTIVKTLETASDLLEQALPETGLLIEVLPDLMRWSGEGGERVSVGNLDLARRLHSRNVARMRFDGAPSVDELQLLAKRLAHKRRDEDPLAFFEEKFSTITLERLQLDQLFLQGTGPKQASDEAVWDTIVQQLHLHGVDQEEKELAGALRSPEALEQLLDWVLARNLRSRSWHRSPTATSSW